MGKLQQTVNNSPCFSYQYVWGAIGGLPAAPLKFSTPSPICVWHTIILKKFSHIISLVKVTEFYINWLYHRLQITV